MRVVRRMASRYWFAMRLRQLLIASRSFVLIAVCIALTATGFAHRSAALPMDADLLAYVQAGGTLSELCGDLDENGMPVAQTCEACLLVAAALLPGSDQTFVALDIRPARVQFSLGTPPTRSTDLDLSRATRAPPAT